MKKVEQNFTFLTPTIDVTIFLLCFHVVHNKIRLRIGKKKFQWLWSTFLLIQFVDFIDFHFIFHYYSKKMLMEDLHLIYPICYKIKRIAFSHFHFCYWEYFLILFNLHICGLLTNQPRLISNENFFIPSILGFYGKRCFSFLKSNRKKEDQQISNFNQIKLPWR